MYIEFQIPFLLFSKFIMPIDKMDKKKQGLLDGLTKPELRQLFTMLPWGNGNYVLEMNKGKSGFDGEIIINPDLENDILMFTARIIIPDKVSVDNLNVTISFNDLSFLGSEYIHNVLGLLFVDDSLYWCYLKKDSRQLIKGNIITLEKSIANRIDEETVNSIFLPTLRKTSLDISFEQSIELLSSEIVSDNYLGIKSLFYSHAYLEDSWQHLVEYFRNKDLEKIHFELVYYLSHLVYDYEHYRKNQLLTNDAKNYGLTLLNEFDKSDIERLIYFFDFKFSYQNISGYWAVGEIINSISLAEELLHQIIYDSEILLQTKRNAIILYINVCIRRIAKVKNYQEQSSEKDQLIKLFENNELLDSDQKERLLHKITDLHELNFNSFSPELF